MADCGKRKNKKGYGQKQGQATKNLGLHNLRLKVGVEFQKPQRPFILPSIQKNSHDILHRQIKKIFCCITIKYFWWAVLRFCVVGLVLMQPVICPIYVPWSQTEA
jgi:hypothetical protein